MERIGGYRLVRKLGEGERAEVWLGHASQSADSMAAIKIYRTGVTVTDIDGEIEALARLSSPHLVELQDIATAPDGRPCLILGRLAGPSLAQVLARRGSFGPGEIVTALAPVAIALAEVHRVGVAHGSVGASSVLLDERGAPVLAAFGRARPVGDLPIDPSSYSLTPAQREAEPLFATDVRALLSLTRTFLDRSAVVPSVDALREWLGSVDGAPPALEELGDRLFDLAPATALRVDSEAVVAHVAFPSRQTAPPLEVKRPPKEPSQWFEQSPLVALRRRLKSATAAVRAPVWIAGAAGLAAFVVAFAVVPSVGTASGAPPASASPTASAAEPSPQSTLVVAAIQGDDPVAAAAALISARARCIANRSVGCLATVEQAASAAIEADNYFLRQLQAGGTVKDRPLDGSQPTLVERLGDSAIIGLGAQTAPGAYAASILIVKLDAGWRIRDLTTGATP